MTATTNFTSGTVVTSEWLNAVDKHVFDGAVYLYDYIPEEQHAAIEAYTSTYDCTSAIMEAHSALPDEGGRIYVGRGSFAHSEIVFTKRVQLIGEGAAHTNAYSPSEFRKLASATGTGVTFSANASLAQGIGFRGETGNTGDGILINASRVTLRDVSVFAMGNDGIRIGSDSGGVNCNLWYLDNVRSKVNGRHGITVSEGAGALADANAGTGVHLDLQSNTSAGIYLGGAQLNSFFGLTAQNNGTYGIHLSATASYNSFFGGDIEANTTANIRLDNGAIYNWLVFATVLTATISNSATTNNNRIEVLDQNKIVYGISFPPTAVPSSDANTLDEYKEGTFTPTVAGASSAGTGTYVTQSGVYTKIGKIVNFTINIEWSAHTGTGNTEIRGLPYTSNNSPALYTPVSIVQSAGPVPGSGKTRLAYIFPNTTAVVLREFDTTTGVVGNSNAITSTGTIYVSGTYTASS